MRCERSVVNLGDAPGVNHRGLGLPIYCFFGAMRIGNSQTAWGDIIQCFTGPVHPFDPVSLANTHSCYSMRLTVVQCAFSGVLLNPPGDSICLGVSLGCALAS